MRNIILSAVIILSCALSATGFAEGPEPSRVTRVVMDRFRSMADDRITRPLREAFCLSPDKSQNQAPLRPTGLMLYGGLDFAQLLPATKSSGLSTSIGGSFSISHVPGTDHLNVQPYIIPSAGYAIPMGGAKGPATLPVDAAVGMSFNCDASTPSDYFLGVGMGGPAGASVYFGMNSTNLFSKAMLATDRSNTPRDYGKIISNARSSEEGLRKSLTAVDSYYPALRGEAAQQLFSQNVPAWRETDPPEGQPLSHWMSETAQASQSVLGNSSSDSLLRRVQTALAHMKQASNDPVAQGELQAEVFGLYQSLGDAQQSLALATFPMTLSRDRRAQLAKSTDVTPSDSWFWHLKFRDRPGQSVEQQVRQAFFTEQGRYRSYCTAGKHRFIAVYTRSGNSSSARQYVDCYSGTLLTAPQFQSVARWIRANGDLVKDADRHRASLGDLTHLLNNTYAQYLTGQPVRPEALKVGGVYTGPVFPGCFSVTLSVQSLIQSGAALLRQTADFSRSALATTPANPTAMVASLAGQATTFGYPKFAPSASLAYPYKLGNPIQIPLSSLPASWQNVMACRMGAQGDRQEPVAHRDANARAPRKTH